MNNESLLNRIEVLEAWHDMFDSRLDITKDYEHALEEADYYASHLRETLGGLNTSRFKSDTIYK